MLGPRHWDARHRQTNLARMPDGARCVRMPPGKENPQKGHCPLMTVMLVWNLEVDELTTG